MSRYEVQWRCRRSILELDLLFSKFFKHHYDQLSKEDQALFHELVLEEDPVLQDLFFNHTEHHPFIAKMLDCHSESGMCSISS